MDSTAIVDTPQLYVFPQYGSVSYFLPVEGLEAVTCNAPSIQGFGRNGKAARYPNDQCTCFGEYCKLPDAGLHGNSYLLSVYLGTAVPFGYDNSWPIEQVQTSRLLVTCNVARVRGIRALGH